MQDLDEGRRRSLPSVVTLQWSRASEPGLWVPFLGQCGYFHSSPCESGRQELEAGLELALDRGSSVVGGTE